MSRRSRNRGTVEISDSEMVDILNVHCDLTPRMRNIFEQIDPDDPITPILVQAAFWSGVEAALTDPEFVKTVVSIFQENRR